MNTTIGITEIVRRIARITHQRNRVVHATMRCLLDEIGEELGRGHTVKLMNFGTFKNKPVPPNWHQFSHQSGHRRITFRPSTLIKQKAQRVNIAND